MKEPASVYDLIRELVCYAKKQGLVQPADEIYATNQLLAALGLEDYLPSGEEPQPRPVHEILEDLLAVAGEKGLLPSDSVEGRDLFDTKLMGLVTPLPSWVQQEFWRHYATSPETATDFYYQFSKATNYIRQDRIVKDVSWNSETPYGDMVITINLSKPEKDPKDIAKAANTASSQYPKCLLCAENEGYAGRFGHPARQNHRVIPLTLEQEEYLLQYSPYVYYNEHCILLNRNHTPMRIDQSTFAKLLDFVRQFPHYTAGSNADLPIVGGSILSHDHFQGGRYTFPMEKAPLLRSFLLPQFPGVQAGVVRWPMTVLRLEGTDTAQLVQAADFILQQWRGYSDPGAMVFSHTEDTPHNTITPIARKNGPAYQLDLVLRNNLTTEEHPLGLYHPHSQYHHIKKENIGLIEVMGLAVLPARLKQEMDLLKQTLLAGKEPESQPRLEKHAQWVKEWYATPLPAPELEEEIRRQIGLVFAQVLECAGVYKQTEEGQKALNRFLASLGAELLS